MLWIVCWLLCLPPFRSRILDVFVIFWGLKLSTIQGESPYCSASTRLIFFIVLIWRIVRASQPPCPPLISLLVTSEQLSVMVMRSITGVWLEDSSTSH